MNQDQKFEVTDVALSGLSLLDVLKAQGIQELPPLHLLRVNGRAVHSLLEPCSVPVVIEVLPTEVRTGLFQESWVLYEDNDIIVCNKPAGLPTQPTVDKHRANLFTLLGEREKERGLSAYVGLHHRLDKDTTGVILFARDKRANASLAEQFQSHKIQKTYRAICQRKLILPKFPMHIENYLGIVGKKGPQRVMGEKKSGGDFAITDVSLVQAFRRFLYVEARPKTGRMHQVRVHLSQKKMPILGDPLYGVPFPGVSRTLLHAHTLSFQHPCRDESMVIEAPLPEEFMRLLDESGSKS